MPNWKKVIVSGSDAILNQVTASSGILLPDDVKLNVGDENDLQIHHDGSNSYIKDNGTGNIFYRGGTQTFQNAAGSKTMVVLNAANSVDLHFNNTKKFETTADGVDITGDMDVSGHITGSTMTNASAIGATHLTGSFTGSFVGDASGLVNLSAAAISNVANDGADRVLTMDGDGTGTAEANLTFNGTILSGSLATTGSFGKVEATNLSGDGSQLSNVSDPNAVVFGIVFGG